MRHGTVLPKEGLSVLIATLAAIPFIPGALAVDTDAPGNWSGLDPAGWYAVHQSPTVFVSVQDTGSGLAVGTAEYRFSTDGGASWSGWARAVVTGEDGTTEIQVVDAPNVPFGQDSGSLNRITFRIADTAGNTGTSPEYNIMIDVTPPGSWTGPAPAGWCNNTQAPAVTVAVRDETSGLNLSEARYRFTADSGLSWSAWLEAAVTGSEGTTAAQTMTATSVPFNADSGSLDMIQFIMKDGAGNTGVSPMYKIKIDTGGPGGWTAIDPSGWFSASKAPTVGISVRDNASGLDTGSARYRYSTDGGGTWSTWVAATVTGADGTTDEQTITAAGVPFGEDSGTRNRIRFGISDIAGNAATSGDYIIKIDTLAPGGWEGLAPSGWYNLSRTPPVSVKVSDVVSGLNTSSALYQFSTDGGATWSEWLPASATGTEGTGESQTVTAADVPFGQDSGSLDRIRFRISDMAGNAGTSGDCTIKMDTTGPGGWASLTPAGWYNRSRTPTVTVDVADATAGLDADSALYQYSTDGGTTWSDWVEATVTGTDGTTGAQALTAAVVPFEQDSAVLNMIRFRISDMAGNVGTSVDHVVRIDTASPGNWTALSPAGWWSSSRAPDITIQVIDATSGLNASSASCQYSVDGGTTWSEWTPAVVTDGAGPTAARTVTAAGVPFNVDSGTRNMMRFQIADEAGNLGASEDCLVKVDRTPPATSIHALPAYSKTRALEIPYDAGDDLSGLAAVELWYSVDGGECQRVPGNLTASPVAFEAPSDGVYSFYTRGTDIAGNYEPVPVEPDAGTTVKTAMREPVIKIKEGTETTGPSAHISGKVEPGSRVQVNGKDVSVDSGGNFTATAPLNEGANGITITVTDLAGNTRTVGLTVNRKAASDTTSMVVMVTVVAIVLAAGAALAMMVWGRRPPTRGTTPPGPETLLSEAADASGGKGT